MIQRRALCLALLVPAGAGATDIPVSATRLVLRASRRHQGASLVLRDPALAGPLADPTRGASVVVNGGAGAGPCRAEIALDPSRWRAARSGLRLR